jgi:hypothetical protein
LNVAVTPDFEKSTKMGIRSLLAPPNIIRHRPPTRATENQVIKVIFIPILLYIKPLNRMAGNSLVEEVKVFRNTFPLMFFI